MNGLKFDFRFSSQGRDAKVLLIAMLLGLSKNADAPMLDSPKIQKWTTFEGFDMHPVAFLKSLSNIDT